MFNRSELEIQNRVFRCWGKTDPNTIEPSIFHPAIYHMLDIGFVARSLLNGKTSNRWKNVFSSIYCVNPALLVSFLPFIISLHDIGKISASFQRINEPQHNRLLAEGFTFGKSKDISHPEIGRNFINFEWPDERDKSVSKRSRKIIREMVAGHHGLFAQPGSLAETQIKIKIEEPPEWKVYRKYAFGIIADVFWDQSQIEIPEPENISAAVMQLTGFTTLCDWIGSDQRYFTPQPALSLDEYKILSLDHAEQAVTQDGFAFSTLSEMPSFFHSLFSDISEPRPLQLVIDDIPDEVLSVPSLIVIEAPTGEGKTEAALALAHKIALARKTDELYYALPTTATSNQMFLRVQKYLRDNLSLGVGAKLIHGQAFLFQDGINAVPLSNGAKRENEWANLDWFSSKKRSLLAPFGVGTIDQIELGALNVRHASLRLSGLAGKVIILDEVHAYDTYMTTIVVRLLTWLKSLGTSVILLSATLPASRRTELIQTYHPENTETIGPIGYPSVIIANSKSSIQYTPKAFQPNREVSLQFLRFADNEAAEKARWLVDQVTDGGCACWITNTVNRAQEIYEQVMMIAPETIKKALFHARFPLEQRKEIEDSIVRMVGPDKTSRPEAAIVIGTQVLEQSLDLDFDVMVSDLAPIDLLLQRAGRLHRHSQTNRPDRLKIPKFYVNAPLNDELEPIVIIDKYVYAEYFLKQTYGVIKDRRAIQLPDDFRILVEEVYGEVTSKMTHELGTAYEDLLDKEEVARQEAFQRLIPEPDPEELFTGPAARLTFTESETDASWTVARTRLGERSINVIPLDDLGDYFSFPGCSKPQQKNLTASREIEMAMLRQQIRISQNMVVQALLDQKQNLPEVFTGSPLLKDYFPLWLKEGVSTFQVLQSEYIVRLDHNLGLLINKKGGE